MTDIQLCPSAEIVVPNDCPPVKRGPATDTSTAPGAVPKAEAQSPGLKGGIPWCSVPEYGSVMVTSMTELVMFRIWTMPESGACPPSWQPFRLINSATNPTGNVYRDLGRTPATPQLRWAMKIVAP